MPNDSVSTNSGSEVNEAIAHLRNEVAAVNTGSVYEEQLSADILTVCEAAEREQRALAELYAIREILDEGVPVRE